MQECNQIYLGAFNFGSF